MQSVERKTDNLRHRVKILEKVYNDDSEKIKFLEEKLQEERLRRKKIETFVTEKMSKLEESLKKEVVQRENLEKWLARFFGIVRIQYDGAEEQSSGASAETPEDDRTDLLEEDVSVVKIEPEVTDDGEYTTTDDADAEMTEGSDQDEDESSQKDFQVKSMETSFREIRIQQDGKRASTSADSATAAQSDDRIQKAKKASAMKSIKIKLQPFSCHLCSKRFTLNMKLKSHMKRRHDWVDPTAKKKSSTTPPSMKTVKCTHCSKLFASKASMRQHVTVHTPVRAAMFRCPVAGCDRYYRQLNNFGKHLEERHEDCQFDFVCVQCRERPSFGDSMEAYVGHMDRYHRGMPGAVEVPAEEASGELSTGSE